MSWYTRNDQYSKQKLSADLETLRSSDLNQGFLEFNIEFTQVALSPSKRDVFITVNVSEGEEVHRERDVRFAGDLLVPEEDLRSRLRIRRVICSVANASRN